MFSAVGTYQQQIRLKAQVSGAITKLCVPVAIRRANPMALCGDFISILPRNLRHYPAPVVDAAHRTYAHLPGTLSPVQGTQSSLSSLLTVSVPLPQSSTTAGSGQLCEYLPALPAPGTPTGAPGRTDGEG